MGNVASGGPNRGKTEFGGRSLPIGDSELRTSVHKEGMTKKFNDETITDQPGVKSLKRSNRFTTCVLVRNVSGFTLEAKRVVSWAEGFRGRRVAGYARLSYEDAAGVVDEQIPASGVPNNDIFWIATRGPALVKTPLTGNGNNVFTEGDVLHALTAVTSGATTAGRVFVGATTSPLTYIGRAMSSMTTANTNADILVDLDVYKTN